MKTSPKIAMSTSRYQPAWLPSEAPFGPVQPPLQKGTETAGTPMEHVRWKTAHEYGNKSGVVLGYTANDEGRDLVRFRADDGEMIDLVPHMLFPETVEMKKGVPAKGDLVAWTAGGHQLVGELINVDRDIALVTRLVSGSGFRPELKSVPVIRLRLATAQGAEATALAAHHKHAVQQQQWLDYHDKQFETYRPSSSPDASYTKNFTLTSESMLREGRAHVVPNELIRCGQGQVYVERIENRFGKVVELRGYSVEPESSWTFITRPPVPGQLPQYGTVIQGHDGKLYVVCDQHTWQIMSQLSAGERVRVKQTGAEDVVKDDSGRRSHSSIVYSLQSGGTVLSVEVDRVDTQGDRVIKQIDNIGFDMATEATSTPNNEDADISGQPAWVKRLVPEIDALKIEYQNRYYNESAALSQKDRRNGSRPDTNPNIWTHLSGVGKDMQAGKYDEAVETLGTMVGMGRGIGSWAGGDAYSKIRKLIVSIRMEIQDKHPRVPSDEEITAGCGAISKMRFLRLEGMKANEALRNEGSCFTNTARLDLISAENDDAGHPARRGQYVIFLRDGELIARQWNVTCGFHDRKVIYSGDDPFNRRPVRDLREELRSLEQKAQITAQARYQAEVPDSKRKSKAGLRRYEELLAEEMDKRRGQLDSVARRLRLAEEAYDQAMENASPSIKSSHSELTAKLLDEFPVGARVQVKPYKTLGDYNNFSNRIGTVERGHWDGWYVRLEMRPREHMEKVVLILQSAGLERIPEKVIPAPEPTETIVLPFEKFEKASSACYALMKLSEQRVKDGIAIPVAIPAIKIGGMLVTNMGGSYQGLESKFDAWELSPETTYQGPTTPRYHDEEAIKAGLRKRGDHTGLLVTYRGTRMVLTRKITIKASAPSLQYAVSLVDAKKYDSDGSHGAWREFYCGPVRWVEKAGFTLAIFTKPNDEETTMLYYRNKYGSIENVFVKNVDSFTGPIAEPAVDVCDTPKRVTKAAKRLEEERVMKKLIEALRGLS